MSTVRFGPAQIEEIGESPGCRIASSAGCRHKNPARPVARRGSLRSRCSTSPRKLRFASRDLRRGNPSVFNRLPRQPRAAFVAAGRAAPLRAARCRRTPRRIDPDREEILRGVWRCRFRPRRLRLHTESARRYSRPWFRCRHEEPARTLPPRAHRGKRHPMPIIATASRASS